MKKIFTLTLFILLAASKLFADTHDLDSLKTKLQLTTVDSLKGDIYKQIAAQYLQYDTIKHSGVKRYYQSEALNYTMLALHNYSYYADTLGMRTCFDYLAKVYQSQKKYSQAKWFLLQSNKISRNQHDTFNIITSLVKLSGVKMDNKDYKLAMRDLNEALALSTKNKMPHLEALVQQNFAFLYNRMKDYDKGDLASKRATEIYENIKHDEELKLIATQINHDSTLSKKVTSVVKKKVPASTKKSNKTNPAKRLASL
jgi:tetratricopeptide (TPR) repeat protein